MRTFWKIYYHFKKPQTKSEIMRAMCRIYGWPWVEAKIVRLERECLVMQERMPGEGAPTPTYLD